MASWEPTSLDISRFIIINDGLLIFYGIQEVSVKLCVLLSISMHTSLKLALNFQKLSPILKFYQIIGSQEILKLSLLFIFGQLEAEILTLQHIR